MGVAGYAVIGIILYLTRGSQTATTTEINLNPAINTRFSELKCIVNNMEGTCVDESLCNEDHTILPGGIIDESEFRERQVNKPCSRPFDWCCTQEVQEPKVETKANIECTTPAPNTCPWCVSLYNIKRNNCLCNGINICDIKTSLTRQSAKWSGKLQITKTGLFCMGTMIGSRVILTAATCIKAAQKQMMWARAPSSAAPTQNYTVIYRYLHPEYNTGSHVYDYGLLVLDKNVKWEKDHWKGACLALDQRKTSDVCFAFGYDDNEDYESTILKMTIGSCFQGGSGPDTMCGTTYDADDKCRVTTGSPVLCSMQGSYLLTAVARTPCNRESNALFGSLSRADDWLETTLKSLGLKESHYKIGGATLFKLRSKSK